ncbi:OmpA family protein [Erythrobacter sp. GH1-10]|uniref:OmpA family protein n=1 Tax=Erythrobacter sp. GH1-10 TaxID=3349334 RepID=UPI003877DC75
MKLNSWPTAVAAILFAGLSTTAFAGSGLERSQDKGGFLAATSIEGQERAQDNRRAVCNSGPFILFFDWNDSSLSYEARRLLDEVVDFYADCENWRVSISGHTDTSQSERRSIDLSLERNQVVKEYLVERGLPEWKIATRAWGKSLPRVRTGDGVKEFENRRVEINFWPER